jgi:hypothetical protein
MKGQTMRKKRIPEPEASYVAIDNDKRKPIPIVEGPVDLSERAETALTLPTENGERKPPPRVRKPSALNDLIVAPTHDVEAHRTAIRRVFGTRSEEFSQMMIGKLVAHLRPNQRDTLDETTLNGAIALIASLQPQDEFQAFLAVQVVALGSAGEKFIRMSQRHLNEDYIDIYGSYGMKLLRLQLDAIRELGRLKHGNKQTVEVRHVHIHSGGQGVVGIINTGQDKSENGQN